MGVKFANNAYGTLNASIASGDTSLTLSSGQGARFPSLGAGDYFYATLIDTSNNLEIVKCTSRSSDVLTITRGQEGTTARAYSVGDRVELRVTAAGLDEIQPAIDDLLPTQTGNSGKYLTTNGSASSWGTVTQYSLPSQTGNAGKFLTTNGTTESWGDAGAMIKIASGTLSAGSAVSLDNLFTTTSEIYVIRFSFETTGGQVRMNMRTGGGNSTTAHYAVSDHAYGTTGSNNIHILNNSSYFQFGSNNTASGKRHSGFVELYNPAGSSFTFMNFMTVGYESGSQYDSHQGGGYHATNTAFDGFRLYAGSGTLTGQYIVYECRL